MNLIGQILVDVGCGALLFGYFGICFCAFAEGIALGLLSLIFPFIGFGVAMRRFPWLVWFWGGGIGLIVIGALLV